MAADYVVMAITHSIWILLLARIVGGIAGATQSTAAAFMADTNPPEKRGAGFGLVSAAFGLGFVLGPLIGGLLGDLGPRAPFYAAALLAFVNFAFWSHRPARNCYRQDPPRLYPRARQPVRGHQAHPRSARTGSASNRAAALSIGLQRLPRHLGLFHASAV